MPCSRNRGRKLWKNLVSSFVFLLLIVVIVHTRLRPLLLSLPHRPNRMWFSGNRGHELELSLVSTVVFLLIF